MRRDGVDRDSEECKDCRLAENKSTNSSGSLPVVLLQSRTLVLIPGETPQHRPDRGAPVAMWNSASKLVVAIGFCLTIGFSWGCMGTPAYRMWYRSQWMEDEQARPSLHARLEELEALRSRAGSMSEAEQAQIAANLSRSLADDPTPLYRAHVVRTLAELSTPAATEALRAADPGPRCQRAHRGLCRLGASRQPGRDPGAGGSPEQGRRVGCAHRRRSGLGKLPDPGRGPGPGNRVGRFRSRPATPRHQSSGGGYRQRFRQQRTRLAAICPQRRGGPSAVPSLAERLRELF